MLLQLLLCDSQVFHQGTLHNLYTLTKLDMFWKGFSPCGAKTLFWGPVLVKSTQKRDVIVHFGISPKSKIFLEPEPGSRSRLAENVNSFLSQKDT